MKSGTCLHPFFFLFRNQPSEHNLKNSKTPVLPSVLSTCFYSFMISDVAASPLFLDHQRCFKAYPFSPLF